MQREMEIIRKLINIDNLKDHEVISHLKIDERTFYRYKSRIRKYEMKIWDKQNLDDAKYQLGKLIQSLEDGYIINKRISEDEKQPARDRTEATKTASIFRAQIAKLSKDGPITILYNPNPELPNKGEIYEEKTTV